MYGWGRRGELALLWGNRRCAFDAVRLQLLDDGLSDLGDKVWGYFIRCICSCSCSIEGRSDSFVDSFWWGVGSCSIKCRSDCLVDSLWRGVDIVLGHNESVLSVGMFSSFRLRGSVLVVMAWDLGLWVGVTVVWMLLVGHCWSAGLAQPAETTKNAVACPAGGVLFTLLM